MSGYDGYYDSCGGGCGNGYIGCNTGCPGDCRPVSPDYSPVTVNNTTTPNVEGSSSQGGSSYGNSSNICLSVGNCGSCNTNEDCCRQGAKQLLEFLSTSSLEPGAVITASIFGDIVPIPLDRADALLYLPAADSPNLCVGEQTVSSNGNVVSLCSIRLIAFNTNQTNPNAALRENFQLVRNCSCSCSCGSGMAEALCVYGIGRSYDVTLSDAIASGSALTEIDNLTLVAISNNIAIFSNANNTLFYGIPTCNIAKFTLAT